MYMCMFFIITVIITTSNFIHIYTHTHTYTHTDISLYEVHRKPHEVVTDETLIGVSPRALHSELMCPICLDLMRNTQTTKEVRYSLTECNDSNEYMSMSLFIMYCISFYSVCTGFVRSVLLLHYVVGMYKCIT